MPFFEVTLSDGTTRILQGHNKTQVRAALENVKLNKIMHVRRCLYCKKAPSTVDNRFCQPCWDIVLAEYRETLKDNPIAEEDLHSLVMSFYVDA